MSRSIEDLLNEANQIIEKKASPVETHDIEHEVVKLADLLIAKDQPKAVLEYTPFEKVAHAAAILDTVQNLEQIEKIAQFVDMAKERGYSDSQVEEFLEKRGFTGWKNPLKAAIAAGTIAGLGGAAVGHKKGKEKGYNRALEDIQTAFLSQPND